MICALTSQSCTRPTGFLHSRTCRISPVGSTVHMQQTAGTNGRCTRGRAVIGAPPSHNQGLHQHPILPRQIDSHPGKIPFHLVALTLHLWLQLAWALLRLSQILALWPPSRRLQVRLRLLVIMSWHSQLHSCGMRLTCASSCMPQLKGM